MPTWFATPTGTPIKRGKKMWATVTEILDEIETERSVAAVDGGEYPPF
jgi:hypothetical protein